MKTSSNTVNRKGSLPSEDLPYTCRLSPEEITHAFLPQLNEDIPAGGRGSLSTDMRYRNSLTQCFDSYEYNTPEQAWVVTLNDLQRVKNNSIRIEFNNKPFHGWEDDPKDLQSFQEKLRENLQIESYEVSAKVLDLLTTYCNQHACYNAATRYFQDSVRSSVAKNLVRFDASVNNPNMSIKFNIQEDGNVKYTVSHTISVQVEGGTESATLVLEQEFLFSVVDVNGIAEGRAQTTGFNYKTNHPDLFIQMLPDSVLKSEVLTKNGAVKQARELVIDKIMRQRAVQEKRREEVENLMADCRHTKHKCARYPWRYSYSDAERKAMHLRDTLRRKEKDYSHRLFIAREAYSFENTRFDLARDSEGLSFNGYSLQAEDVGRIEKCTTEHDLGALMQEFFKKCQPTSPDVDPEILTFFTRTAHQCQLHRAFEYVNGLLFGAVPDKRKDFIDMVRNGVTSDQYSSIRVRDNGEIDHTYIVKLHSLFKQKEIGQYGLPAVGAITDRGLYVKAQYRYKKSKSWFSSTPQLVLEYFGIETNDSDIYKTLLPEPLYELARPLSLLPELKKIEDAFVVKKMDELQDLANTNHLAKYTQEIGGLIAQKAQESDLELIKFVFDPDIRSSSNTQGKKIQYSKVVAEASCSAEAAENRGIYLSVQAYNFFSHYSAIKEEMEAMQKQFFCLSSYQKLDSHVYSLAHLCHKALQENENHPLHKMAKRIEEPCQKMLAFFNQHKYLEPMKELLGQVFLVGDLSDKNLPDLFAEGKKEAHYQKLIGHFEQFLSGKLTPEQFYGFWSGFLKDNQVIIGPSSIFSYWNPFKWGQFKRFNQLKAMNKEFKKTYMDHMHKALDEESGDYLTRSTYMELIRGVSHTVPKEGKAQTGLVEDDKQNYTEPSLQNLEAYRAGVFYKNLDPKDKEKYERLQFDLFNGLTALKNGQSGGGAVNDGGTEHLKIVSKQVLKRSGSTIGFPELPALDNSAKIHVI